MQDALSDAMTRLPRKGETRWPFAHGNSRSGRRKIPWLLHSNLHEWAQGQGYLSGCIYKRTRSGGTSYRLLLVAPCPWHPGNLRYFTAPFHPLNPETTP